MTLVGLIAVVALIAFLAGRWLVIRLRPPLGCKHEFDWLRPQWGAEKFRCARCGVTIHPGQIAATGFDLYGRHRIIEPATVRCRHEWLGLPQGGIRCECCGVKLSRGELENARRLAS